MHGCVYARPHNNNEVHDQDEPVKAIETDAHPRTASTAMRAHKFGQMLNKKPEGRKQNHDDHQMNKSETVIYFVEEAPSTADDRI